MSVPKVIHYCWFGGNPLPPSALKCIKSWKKFCPDYQIIEWNESNFDISGNRYAREASSAGKWAFVSDYARLKIIYDHGGIYLDTDVELLCSFDPLLDSDGFLGFQSDGFVATGLGFGAVRHHPVIHALLDDYQNIPFFLENGKEDLMPCPNRNTKVLQQLGLTANMHRIQNIKNLLVYPPEYFCPKNFYTGHLKITRNTYSIHHYDSSWFSPERKAYIRHLHRMHRLEKLLGSKLFAFIKYLWHRLHGKPE